MNWARIAWSATLPMVFASPFVAALWRKRQFMIGTVVGAGILFAAAVTYAGAEFVDSQRNSFECLAPVSPCPPGGPSDFTKMATYGIVAFIQVAGLFVLCERFERRHREDEYAPEWKR